MTKRGQENGEEKQRFVFIYCAITVQKRNENMFLSGRLKYTDFSFARCRQTQSLSIRFRSQHFCLASHLRREEVEKLKNETRYVLPHEIRFSLADKDDTEKEAATRNERTNAKRKKNYYAKEFVPFRSPFFAYEIINFNSV